MNSSSPAERKRSTESAPSYRLVESPDAVAANREWYPGLCRTCVYDDHCVFPRSVEHAVLQCGEFEPVQQPAVPMNLAYRNESALAALANREWYPGLCSTCDRSETCQYPKPEGGVFHCEEYN